MPDITDPNSPNLPAIDSNPDQPLPVMDSKSSLVPYRIGTKQPGGEYVYTTGYGQRGARPAVQPPGGGGVGVPDLSRLYAEAFSRLPVDEALKATEMATRYIGQRGYMQDLQAGKNAAQAFAKWGPMLFKTATGIPEAIDRSIPTPITPQQLIQNAQAERRLKDAESKTAQGDVRVVGGGLYRVKPGAAAPETLLAPKPINAGGSTTETYKIPAVEGQPAVTASAGIPILHWGARPARAAVAAQPERTVRKTVKGTADASADEEPADATDATDAAAPVAAAPAPEVIRVTKDGKKAVFDSATKKFLRYENAR